MAAYIQARNVKLTFRPANRAPVRALDAFDMDVEDGEFISMSDLPAAAKAHS